MGWCLQSLLRARYSLKAFGRDIVHMDLHPRGAADFREGDDLADMPNVGDGLDFPESRSAALGGDSPPFIKNESWAVTQRRR